MITLITLLCSAGLIGLATLCYGDWGPIARWRYRRLLRRFSTINVQITASTERFTHAIAEAQAATYRFGYGRTGMQVMDPPGTGQIMKSPT